jgi:serine/threonine protein kinase/tetratricopeptide (TPR) repeat protein
MTLATGTKLGPYEIEAPLGAGGMGEVYRARDTRLDRTVAIKILPASLSDNADARQRFQREAKAISSLQHPNICTLYDIGTENGVDFLVMECLEGETLQNRLLRGLLSVEQVRRHGMEIADALDAAHRKGFVHRDLKPSNVFVTRHGEAKVLDFGLVKQEEEALTDQPTITSPANLTSPGSALGTVAYMSPEQARGDELDARTDIFSFGAVLYEMTTGKPAFPGKTSAVIFKAILDQTPAAPSQLNPEFPPRLEEIIFKALEKDRDVRYQSAADIRADLRRLRRDTERAGGTITSRIDSETQTKTWWHTKRAIIAGVLAVVVVATAAYFFRARSNQTIDSIAVLPFANASADPSMEYLSDGITEGIIDRLSGLPNVKVISRTSAFRYKKGDIEPQKVARELGVQALVTGRVIQRGEDLSVSAELVDTREDKQIWGEQYSRKPADIGSVQQEIASAISGNLRVRLTSEEKTRLGKPYSANAEAYQLYLKGRYHQNQTTAEGYRKGIEYFQQAIDKDPGYALAYAGLAGSYAGLGGGNAYASPRETLPKAKAAANKALELDETVGEAHAALGYAGFLSDWNWTKADREFRRAIELNPNNAISHAVYSEILGTQERFDESVAEGERAQKLDPLSPHALTALGYAYLSTHRYDEAITQFQSALELDPNAGNIRAQLAWAYGAKRMYPQAIAEYEKIPEPERAMTEENQTVTSGMGWLYAVSGRRADALKMVKEFKDLSSHAYVDPYNIAVIYAGLGDKDEVFLWLEKGYEQRSSGMPYLTADPFWDGIHSDRRYVDLLRRMRSTRPSD